MWGGRLVVCPQGIEKEASCGRGELGSETSRQSAVAGKLDKLERRHWVSATTENLGAPANI